MEMHRWIVILKIIDKYCNNEYNYNYPLWAEHDIIGFNIDIEEVSEEDLQYLDQLGVFYSDEYDSLIKYV